MTESSIVAQIKRTRAKDKVRQVAKKKRAIPKGLSLVEFCSYIPGYRLYEWHKKLAAKLQAVADRKIKRLMVFAPPQHGKSTLASQIFLAYFVYRYPHLFSAVSSYSSDLGIMASKAARRIWKEQCGGENQPDEDTYSLWRTIQGGGVWAAGVGGSATGKPIGGVGVIDDPIKDDKEARSPTVNRENELWYSTVWESRLAEDAAIVVIQTRWSLNDLSAWLLQEKAHEDWHIVSFPAIADSSLKLFIPSSCTLEAEYRKDGEPLCPEIRSLNRLKEIEVGLDYRIWMALYQQCPIVEGGAIYKEEGLRFFDPTHPPEAIQEYAVSIDASFKKTVAGSYVVIQFWGVGYPNFYLLDQVRDRMSFTETLDALKASVVMNSIKYGVPNLILIEEKANGDAIISQVKDHLSGVIPFNPRQDSKEARYEATSPQVKAGNVWLPHRESVSWVPGFIHEITTVPFAGFDDQADAMAQILLYYFSRKKRLDLSNLGSYGQRGFT